MTFGVGTQTDDGSVTLFAPRPDGAYRRSGRHGPRIVWSGRGSGAAW